MKPKRFITSALNKRTNRLRLILGDQLDLNHSWFKANDPCCVYLIAELKQEQEYTTHHIQKICAFFLGMEHFASQLANLGHQVIYLTLNDTQTYQTLEDLLIAIINHHHIEHFDYQRPDEYRLLHQLAHFKPKNLLVNRYESEHFLLSYNEIQNEFKPNKHSKMEFFYRRMRKRFNILMEGNQPLGGKWNYDADNRSSFKAKDLDQIPQPKLFDNDATEILSRIKKHNVKTIGECPQQLIWPINREQSLMLLKYFCKNQLESFGKFQDAMTDRSDYKWSLYHSRISFALNAKIISPLEVINTAIQYWESHQDQISLPQIEGFVRQMIGWREYIRGIYWSNMPHYAEKNYLNANRKLPSYFWNGNTKMNCMHQAISQSLEHAYAHHIQRLMITGNFCLLTGIQPDEVDQWYLGIYIDAIEWVEMPNTRGMTQFGDGGIVATKPYAASGSYVNKMSDYCKNCHYKVKLKTEDNACPLNSLYWNFVAQNSDYFKSNSRMTMIYKSWDKMDHDLKNQLIKKAQAVILDIENL